MGRVYGQRRDQVPLNIRNNHIRGDECTVLGDAGRVYRRWWQLGRTVHTADFGENLVRCGRGIELVVLHDVARNDFDDGIMYL
jgi:hypothetical protein